MFSQEALLEYQQAVKKAHKEVKELTAAGKSAYPMVLDEILPVHAADVYQDVGIVEIPADRIIGMKGIVLQTIDNQAATGQVRVGGQIWTARSQDPTVTYPEGSEVTIRAISGVKVIVSQ